MCYTPDDPFRNHYNKKPPSGIEWLLVAILLWLLFSL